MTRAAKELCPHPSFEPQAGQPEHEPQSRADRLARTIAGIKEAARRDPEAYLRETVVPEGGE